MKLVTRTFGILLLALALCVGVQAEEKKLTLDISADFMIRPEIRSESDFDSSVGDEEDFVGQRIKLKFAGSIYDARYVVQLLDGREWGQERKTGSSTSLSMAQGYIELGDGFDLRIGRQEITWGKKRLIGSTGWDYKNLAAYDGIRFLSEQGSSSYDAFLVAVAEFETKVHDDSYLAGAKYAFTGSEVWKPEVYLLYHFIADNPDATGDQGTSMPIPGTLGYVHLGPVDLDYELILQTGTSGGIDHSANFFHLGAKYSIPNTKFWLEAEYNFASGDGDPTDNTKETFDKLYGINHSHYGYIDYQDPRNMKNLRLVAGAKWTPTVSTQLEYHTFELAEAKDKWYSRTATVSLHDPTGAAGTDVGSEIDLKCKFKLPYKLDLEVGAALFMTGEFINTLVGPNVTDSSWAYVQLKRSF